MTDTGALSSPPPGSLLAPPGMPKDLPKKPDYTQFTTQIADADKTWQDRGDALRSKSNSIVPPNPPAPTPMPKVESTNPLKAWGSSAMVLAMLASAFTRQHFTTALNAAAAVLKGYKQGDIDAANMAFKQWQVASENALKAQEFQNNTYMKLLGEVDREQRLNDQAHNTQLQSIKAEMSAAAHSYGDARMEYLLRTQDVRTAILYTQDMIKNTDTMRKNEAKLEAEHIKAQAMHTELNELHKKPEYIHADAVGKAAMDLKVVQSVQSEAAPLTPVQKAHLETTLASQFNTQGIAKTYNEVSDKWPTVLQIERALKDNGQVNAQQSATLVDTFQRMYNNQAVRVGLVKINTEHQPFIDKLELQLSKFSPGGGGVLAPNQAEELLDILHPYHDTIVDRRKQEADFKTQQANLMGLDPDAVVPPQFREGGDAPHTQAAWAAPATLTDNPAGFLTTAFGRPVTMVSKPTDKAFDFTVHGMSNADAGEQLVSEMKQHGVAFDEVKVTPAHVELRFAPANRGALEGGAEHHPTVPGAKKAPDGHYYVQKNGAWFRVED